MAENLGIHTLAIFKNGKIKYYNQRNLKPVFLALEENNIRDAFIVDRRISKASAILFAYGGAKHIKTPLMTKSAKEFFDKQGISYEADEIVDSVLDKNSKEIPQELNKAKNDFDALPKSEQDELLLFAKCRKDVRELVNDKERLNSAFRKA